MNATFSENVSVYVRLKEFLTWSMSGEGEPSSLKFNCNKHNKFCVSLVIASFITIDALFHSSLFILFESRSWFVSFILSTSPCLTGIRRFSGDNVSFHATWMNLHTHETLYTIFLVAWSAFFDFVSIKKNKFIFSSKYRFITVFSFYPFLFFWLPLYRR